MTYWNPVLQYGVDRYAEDLLAAGGAGRLAHFAMLACVPEALGLL